MGRSIDRLGSRVLGGFRWQRIAVETTEDTVIARTSVWMHTNLRSDILDARLTPMPTRSAFARRWPCLALALLLQDRTTHRFL